MENVMFTKDIVHKNVIKGLKTKEMKSNRI